MTWAKSDSKATLHDLVSVISEITMQAAKGGKYLNGSQMQDLQTMALSVWQEVLKAAVKVERPCRFCGLLSPWGCQFLKRLLNFVSFWSLTGFLCFLQERRLQSRENKYTTKGWHIGVEFLFLQSGSDYLFSMKHLRLLTVFSKRQPL